MSAWLMAFPGGDEAEGEHAFGVSARGENTHEPDSGGPRPHPNQS